MSWSLPANSNMNVFIIYTFFTIHNSYYIVITTHGLWPMKYNKHTQEDFNIADNTEGPPIGYHLQILH